MPTPVPTGRPLRRVVASGTFSIPAAPNETYVYPGPGSHPEKQPYHCRSKFSVTLLGGLFSANAQSDVQALHFDSSGTAYYAIDRGGAGFKAQPGTSQPVGVQIPWDVSGGATGSWEMRLDMEEFWWDLDDGAYFPALPAQGEIQTPRRYMWIALRPAQSGTAYCRITVGGRSAEIEIPASLLGSAFLDTEFGWNALLSAGVDGWDRPATASATCAVDGLTLGIDRVGARQLGANPSVETIVDFQRGVSASVGPTPGWPYAQYGVPGSYFGGVLYQTIPAEYRFTGDVRGLDAPLNASLPLASYPMSIEGGIEPHAAGPSFDFVVRRSTVRANVQNVDFAMPAHPIIDMPGGQGAAIALDRAAMLAASEGDDPRLLIRAVRKDPGVRLRQAERVTVDPCTSARLWQGVSASTGVLLIDSSRVVTAKATYGSVVGFNSEGYRYLRIKVRPPVSGSRLGIVIKTRLRSLAYVLEAGPAGEWSEIEADLCAPVGSEGGIDAQDSRWPLDPATDSPAAEGTTWGASSILEVSVSFPKSTGSYAIGGIFLVAKNPPEITIMPSEASHPDYEGVPLVNLLYRGIVADTDGRRSLEIPGLLVAAGGGRFRTTLAAAKIYAEQIPGWSLDVPEELRDGLVCWLASGGYDETENRTWLRYPWPQSRSIPYRETYDGVIAPPATGDIFGGGGYGGPTLCRVHKLLRGTFGGLVIGADGTPQHGVKVESRENGSLSGSGLADDAGVFRLGLPHSRSGLLQAVTADGADEPATLGVRNRDIVRVGFRPGAKGLGVDLESDRYLYLLFVASTKGLEVRRSWDLTGPLDSVFPVDSAPDCADPAALWIPQRGRLLVAYVRGGTHPQLWLASSYDRGETWIRTLLMTGPTHSRLLYHASSRETLAIVREADRRIRLYAYDDSGAVSGPYPANGIGEVDSSDASFGATSPTGTKFVDVAFVDVSGAPRRFRSVDHGRSFIELGL